MSRDCDYLFVWEIDDHEAGHPAPLALAVLENLEAHTGYRVFGTGTVIDHDTLYWACTKHSLPLDKIVFPVKPDQIFERADGGLFRIVQPSVMPG